MSTNYYDILGVEKTASEQEIKKAFRALAHTHHPDKGGDEKKFKEINEAYQTLSNKDKKAQYDRFGSTSSSFGSGNTGFGGAGGGFNYADFTRASGTTRQFKMFSLKKVPWIIWILLIPIIFIIIIFGIVAVMIYLFFRIIRNFSKI